MSTDKPLSPAFLDSIDAELDEHAAADAAMPVQMLGDDPDPMAEECERLQNALAFWLPQVPPADHPLHARIANDAYLLFGVDGPNTEPSAYEQGLVDLLSHPKSIEAPTPKPFMFAIMGPDGKAHIDEQCVGSVADELDAEVQSLNEWQEEGVFSVVPVYLALPAAATAVPAPGATWLPIDTAPKTSRAILVWCPERKNTYQVNWYMERWEHFGGASRPLYESPTHWMPLPPAPGAQAAPVAQLSEPPEKFIEAILEAAYDWAEYVDVDRAPCTLVKYLETAIAEYRAAPTTPKDAA